MTPEEAFQKLGRVHTYLLFQMRGKRAMDSRQDWKWEMASWEAGHTVSSLAKSIAKEHLSEVK